MAAFLSRTYASAGNRKTFTISTWLKITNLSNPQSIFYGDTAGNTNGTNDDFYYNANTITYGGYNSGYITSTALFRDVAAWYHVVLSVDTTQATSANRIKLYVNGVEQARAEGAGYPAQNFETAFIKSGAFQICGNSPASGFGLFNLASYYYIDGQALTPTSFGQTDATTGIWKPKTYSGTYGTNGFFLKFENSASLGLDSSGNGNNFTVNGTPTQTVDTPSNVFCTLNAIQSGSSISTLTNGNLTAGTNDNKGVAGTLGVNKGKWYWEVKNSGTQTNQRFGVSNRENEQDGDASPSGDTANVRSYVGLNYQKNYSASSGTTNTSFVGTNGAIFGFALDLDNGTLGRYVNGTLISTDTTLPSNNSVTFFPFTFVTYNAGNWNLAQFNFGNGVFGTTAISSPYSDTAGLGKFQYAVPAGYYSLCTKNINSQG